MVTPNEQTLVVRIVHTIQGELIIQYELGNLKNKSTKIRVWHKDTNRNDV